MTLILDKWDELDPARALRRISLELANCAIYDQWAVLDVALAARRINAVAPGTIGPAQMGDIHAFMHAVQVAIDDASGTPEWVPANAKIFIDLVNVRAWTQASGVVAIDTLLGSDPNTVNGWDVSSYDPANLTADGYVCSGTILAFIGDARSTLLSGATFNFRLKNLASPSTSAYFALLTADGEDAIELDIIADNTRRLAAFKWSGTSERVEDVINAGAGAINVIAATITSSRIEAAANGSSVIEYNTVHPDVAAAALIPNSGKAIQSITIYDALPDTTGLSALSETA